MKTYLCTFECESTKEPIKFYFKPKIEEDVYKEFHKFCFDTFGPPPWTVVVKGKVEDCTCVS